MALIFAKDMERMTAFYRDAIGMEFLAGESSVGWAVFNAGGARVALHAMPLEIAKNVDISVTPRARSDTPIKLFFRCDNLQEARAHLLASGAVMFEPAHGRCHGLDPEGNVFSIVTG